MKTTTKIVLLLALIVFSGGGCTEDLIPQEVAKDSQVIVSDAHTNLVLGERRKNPYSLENMRQAIKELPSVSKAAIGEIKATHLYVKFIPKDSVQYAEISNDTTIFYYPYPLDYEIVSGGDYYQEDGGYGYPCEYCVFEIGQKIPEAQYQVIDSCFILEEVNVYDDASHESLMKTSYDDVNWSQLESIAMRLAGIESTQTLSKKWTPACTLMYEDNTLNKNIPLKGVPVRCRKNFLVSHQSCTNGDGVATFDKLKGKVDYQIHWKRADFKIRPNTGLDEAFTILKENTDNVYRAYFYKNSGSYTAAWKYASIFRAVQYFYYENIDGLSRPGNSNLSIRACDHISSDSVYGKSEKNWISSDIHIYYLNRESSGIYGTVIHELTHVQHRKSVCATDKLFFKTDDCIVESWAVGVQNYLTAKIYPGYERGYFDNEYTYVVTDILKRKPRYGVSSNASYTIAELEGTLRHARNWNEWKSIVKSKYQRNNEKYIDAVFDYWANYSSN